MVFALAGMLLYIWLRFELRFGVGALMASLRFRKSLNVPDREKGLVYEAQRVLAQIRGTA